MYKVSPAQIGWFKSTLPLAAIAIACLAWYLPFPFTTLVGDDLYNFGGMRSGLMLSNLHQVFLESWLDKYRPFFFAIFSAEFHLFGNHIAGYVACNLVTEILSGLVFLRCASLVACNRHVVCLALTAIFLTSHFAIYQLWQTTGIVEGLATLFFLLTLWCLLHARHHPGTVWAWLSVAAWAASVFTHERYLLFAPALIGTVLILPWPSRAGGRRTVAPLLIPFAVVLICMANVIIKELVLGSHFMTATGGQALHLSPRQIADLCWAATKSILGFNTGPTYLSGENFADAEPWVTWVAGTLIASLLMTAIVAHWPNRRRLSRENLRALAVFVLWFGTAIASASLTFRQEFRWLLAPEIVLLLGVAALSGLSPASRLLSAILGCFVAANLVLSWHFRQADRTHLFFINAEQLAENTKALLSKLPGRPTAVQVLTDNPGEVCNWTFGQGKWFADYAAIPADQVTCVSDITHGLVTSAAAPSPLALAIYHYGQVRDVTAALQTYEAARPDGEIVTDLYSAAQNSVVTPSTIISAPGGHGGFTGTWSTTQGPERSIIVVSGFQMRIPADVGQIPTDLVADVATLYPQEHDIAGIIDIEDQAGSRHEVWRGFLKRPAETIAEPRSIHVPLDQFAGQQIAIILRAEPLDQNAGGNWAMFGGAAIRKR